MGVGWDATAAQINPMTVREKKQKTVFSHLHVASALSVLTHRKALGFSRTRADNCHIVLRWSQLFI